MTLLQAFIAPKGYKQKPRFSPGQLTIVDLSDPFIDPAAACGLFEIITRLFVRANVDTGKVLVVDEAHKVRFISYNLIYHAQIPISIYVHPRPTWVSRKLCYP